MAANPPSNAELGFALFAVVVALMALLLDRLVGGKPAAAVGFMTCSACLLLANKVAVHHVQLPITIVFVQLATTAGGLLSVQAAGGLTIDRVGPRVLRKFAPLAMAFLATVMLGAKILQHTTVEAMIVVRASANVVVACLDVLILKKPLPSAQGLGALGLLVGSSTAFAYFQYHEAGPRAETGSSLSIAALWVGLWYGVFCFDQIYIKHVVDAVKLPPWTNAFYTNVMSSLAMLPLVVLEDHQEVLSVSEPVGDWSHGSILVVAATCVLGLLMSYFSFLARAAYSATYFTLLGTVCKVLTVTMNRMIWDNHATVEGTVCTLFTLLAAYLYDDKPKPKKDPPPIQFDPEEMQEKPDSGGRRQQVSEP